MPIIPKFLILFVLLSLVLALGCRTATTPPTSDAHTTAIAAAEFRERLDECRLQLLRDDVKRMTAVDNLGFGTAAPILCYWPSITAPEQIDVHRSLMVHDRATLDAGNFTLARTLDQIASQVSARVPGTTRVGLFRQFWDIQNPAPGFTAGPHCDDNGQTVNGYPVTCRTGAGEGSEAAGNDAAVSATIDTYKALALVNRLDLAHEGWSNCGEYRIIYGTTRNANNENLIIFEAVLPNPHPGCPCVAVAEFWKALSAIDDPAVRAAQLTEFFYTGIPGFRPVVHVDHYSATGAGSRYGGSGSGQIRTNQFLIGPWMLKEFKTVLDCGAGGAPCSFQIVPIAVKTNPYGLLWNEDLANTPAHPLSAAAASFQAGVTNQISSLSSGNLMGITYSVQLAHDGAESSPGDPADPVQHTSHNYLEQFNAAVLPPRAFRDSLASGNLTAEQVVNRAMTQSCAGCHHPANLKLTRPNAIGPVTTPTGSTVDSWPNAVFRHVRPTTAVLTDLAAAGVFGNGSGQPLSAALTEVFLPARKAFLLDALNHRRCPCLHRFTTLTDQARRRAIDIQQRVQRRFEARFETLGKNMNEARAQPAAYRALERKAIALHRELNTELHAELRKAGIRLSDVDIADATPRTMDLQAAARAHGDKKREQALRTADVNRALQEQPPRRTIAGSFAPH